MGKKNRSQSSVNQFLKKEIILNGCSWVAGDEIVWKQFCEENCLGDEDYYTFEEKYKFKPEKRIWKERYMNQYRPKHNQAAMMTALLNTKIIDLSQDGNSNDGIALGTINYILSIPKEERSRYHVVAAWTILEREVMFFPEALWENIHISMLDNLAAYWPFKEKIRALLLNKDNNEWYLNFIKNIMLLENFLIANNISYTFYKSLGNHKSFTENLSTPGDKLFYTKENKNIGRLDFKNLKDDITDASKWIVFFHRDVNSPLIGDSWTRWMQEHYGDTFWVTKKNRHPSVKFTLMLSNILSDYIKNNKLLDL